MKCLHLDLGHESIIPFGVLAESLEYERLRRNPRGNCSIMIDGDVHKGRVGASAAVRDRAVKLSSVLSAASSSDLLSYDTANGVLEFSH